MKRGWLGFVLVLIGSVPLCAGPFEIFIGAGPGAATFDEVNASIEVINVLLRDLNDTPTFEGDVPDLPLLTSGTAYQGGERYRTSEQLSFGGKIGAFHSETTTEGSYTEGGETSEIAIALSTTSVSVVLGGQYEILTSPVRLGVELGAAYAYSGFASDITFEIPASYPPISIHPREGRGRYSAHSFGLEGGLSLALPIAEWLSVRASVAYRLLSEGRLTDLTGAGLDIDGDGRAETVGLSGVTVQFGLSFIVNLPWGERKE